MGISGEGLFQAEGTARAKTPRQECVATVARAEGARRRAAGDEVRAVG